jgi:hypothetical protein
MNNSPDWSKLPCSAESGEIVDESDADALQQKWLFENSHLPILLI